MNKYTKTSGFLQNQFDDLSSKEKNDFLRDLESFLKDQDSAYYGSNISNISDAEYDKLKLLYHKLVTNNPEVIDSNYSKSVGFKPSDKFEKVNHKVPMLSLSNIFDNDGVTEFIERVRRYLSLGPNDNLEIVSEPKIDGLSATLLYINGNLHIGATRGDGSQGENVTQNIKTISNENKLPIDNINNFKPSDVANQTTKDKKDLYNKLTSLNKENETQFLKVGDKFFVVELDKINTIQKKITDKEVKDSILSQLNLIYKLKSNTDIVKKINEKKGNFLENFSRENNLQIKDLEISNSKNQNIFSKNILTKIFEIRDNETALITDNSFKKNFLVLSLNTEFIKMDSKLPNYDQLKATTKLKTAQQIFNLYDKNLNKKYSIEVNQKVLDRIKNSF